MKRKLLVLLTAALLMITMTGLSGCVQASVGVSMNADENKFILEFRSLNTSKYHTFELAAGDEIEAEIVLESGDVYVSVQKGKDAPVYEGAKPPSGTFRIRITDGGAYRITVTGNGAKGSTQFHVIRTERKEGEE